MLINAKTQVPVKRPQHSKCEHRNVKCTVHKVHNPKIAGTQRTLAQQTANEKHMKKNLTFQILTRSSASASIKRYTKHS